MQLVSLTVLRNRLSEYVRLAAGGETVLVTDRDRVVAELAPPRLDRNTGLAGAIPAEAVPVEWITPPTFIGDELPPRRPVVSFERLMDQLAEDREDRCRPASTDGTG